MPQHLALLITWLVEVPVLVMLFRALPRATVVLAGVSASLITHPVAWWAASLLSPHDHAAGVWVIELAVVMAEGLWLCFVLRTQLRQTLSASAVANMASFALGWALLP